MVFITLVCSYLSSTLLKINAEQIIKLSSQNLGKSFALIAAGKAGRPHPKSPLPVSGLVWWVGREDFLAGAGGTQRPHMRRDRPDRGWEAGWRGPFWGSEAASLGAGAGVFEGGSAGVFSPSLYTQTHSYRYTHADRHTDACKHMHPHARTHTHTGTLTCCCWELVPFVWPLNGPPATMEHDSFRRLMPQACLVPVLATSAGQVVRRVPGLGGTCPGAPLTPPSWARKAPTGSSASAENGNFTPPPEALLCPSWARDGPALQGPTSPSPQQGPRWPCQPPPHSGQGGPCSLFWLQPLAWLQRLSHVWLSTLALEVVLCVSTLALEVVLM